jgi:hypothetical protein
LHLYSLRNRSVSCIHPLNYCFTSNNRSARAMKIVAVTHLMYLLK